MSYLHIGLDYGTSASKVLIRDDDAPGGARTYPLLHEGSYRISSDLAVVGDRLHLGRSVGDPSLAGATWYRSVKMRMAQAKGAIFFGTPFAALAPPLGWTFEELAVLSVAWLVAMARRKGGEIVAQRGSEPSFAMTLGIPSDFRELLGVNGAFLVLARAGFSLAKQGTVGCEPCLRLTQDLATAVRQAMEVATAAGRTEESAWIRSEARASIWWAWKLPTFEAGPYVAVDVGAGTTNVAAFIVTDTFAVRGAVRERVNEGISVLAATSGTVGVNAAEAAAREAGAALTDILRPRQPIRTELERPYRAAFGLTREKVGEQGPAWEQWRRARLLMLGGGRMFPEICRAFGPNPFRRTNVLEQAVFDTVPADIALPSLSAQTMPDRVEAARTSLTVAYGLSVPDDALPSETLPFEIVAIPPSTPRRAGTLAGIYEK